MQRPIAGTLRAARSSTTVLTVSFALLLLLAGAVSAQARRTRDFKAPSTPGNLVATAGDQKVDLTWTASRDNVGVKGYRIYRNAVRIATVSGSKLSPRRSAACRKKRRSGRERKRAARRCRSRAAGKPVKERGARRSYTDTTVVDDNTATYLVKAYDAAGNLSPASKQVTAKPTHTNNVKKPTSSPEPAPTPGPTSSPSPAPSGPPVAGNWTLRMNDEFTSIDSSRWLPKFWWNGDTFWPNHELQVYKGGCSSNGNELLMSAQRASGTLTAWNGQTANSDGEPYQYTSCFLSTGGSQTVPAGYLYTYGYAEARMWVSGGKGIWPGFWMQRRDGTTGSFVDDTEIDVLELIGSSPNTAEMHFHGPQGTYGAQYNSPTPLTAGYHTYGVDWEPGSLTWYIDGVQRGQLTRSDVPSTPHYLMFNLAVGGSQSWPGAPDASTPFPSVTKVDYLRVWQH